MPTDKPFDFNLNSVKVEAKKCPPFTFAYGSDNQVWTMTHRELLDQLQILEAVESSNAAGTLVLLRLAFGAEQWAKFRKLGLNDKQIEVLSDKYNEHCGVDTGESSGSTDS